MSKSLERLKNPAPIIDKPWNFVILNTIVSTIILAIFEPFAFRLNSFVQFKMLLGFSLLSFLASTLFFVLLPKLFPSYFYSERWTYRRMFQSTAFFLLFVGLCVFFYEYILMGNHSRDEYWSTSFFLILLVDLIAGVTISLIPLSISFYMAKSRSIKKNLEEAINLNQQLLHRLKEQPTIEHITLEGSTKDSLSVPIDSLLYMESDGNYVDIFYHDETHTKRKTLRTTIKQMEEQLQTHPQLIRCHRAFIVNTKQLSKVSGNAQGYKLSLNHTSQEVPVSRTYLKALKDSLA